MTRMVWNAPEERFFDAGLDRGVIYPEEGAKVDAIVEKNFIENPSFESNANFWALYSTGTVISPSRSSVVDSSAPRGTRVCRIQAASLSSATNSRVGLYSDPMSLDDVGGGTYTLSADLGPLLPGQRWNFSVTSVTSGDDPLDDASVSVGSGGRKSFTVELSEGAAFAQVSIHVSGTGVGPATAVDTWVDGVLFVVGTSTSYFDGENQGTAYVNEWLGDSDNSASTRQRVVSSAVPWNGLISVDEEGGEGAAEYYIDGRPFLYLPRPKEYKASLSAYTYPDAFAEIMGMAEIADGMYLDSQMGKSFSLSYRTLVGNGLNGIDHGYKIHLVYNATVTPQSKTHESMGQAINPIAFSWDIQAVPVPVSGYRPTAHIIIDTRHMIPSKIEALENLLYGSEVDIAGLPAPQVIFDLLNFGDRITVTDNGDGTFTVEGSYENVYMIGPGEFRVDNVDGTNNADGTFTISTTEG